MYMCVYIYIYTHISITLTLTLSLSISVFQRVYAEDVMNMHMHEMAALPAFRVQQEQLQCGGLNICLQLALPGPLKCLWECIFLFEQSA